MTTRQVRAARGNTLRCKGWRQEALLRLLENNIENGERPEELIIYSATAKAARNWGCFDRIVSALQGLEEDETLVMQSGKPIGIFRTHRLAPRVVMANANLVGKWATADHFRELEEKGLSMVPGYTAAAWQYIGTQGILQGTYETFAAAARASFGGSLVGRWVLTGGLGGMGGAQPLAVTMNGGAVLAVEVDEQRIRRRIATGYCQRISFDLEEALRLCLEAKAAGQALSVGLVGNTAQVLPEIVARGLPPDIVTDQTSAHDTLVGYIPEGLSLVEAATLRRADPETYKARALDSIARHMRALLEFQRRGAVAFEYGNNIRAMAKLRGVEDAFEIEGFIPKYIRPMFCEGRGPFRWIAVSGEARDIAAIDELVLREFSGNGQVTDWIRTAKTHVVFQGLPARICWLAHGERGHLAGLVNDLVRRGVLAGPVAFTRDHLDCGGVARPYRETENLLDGSDAVADWPILNALLNASSMADLVAVHSGGAGSAGYYVSAGVTVVADGTQESAVRLERTLTSDTGLGVLRYADAGYEAARRTAKEKGIREISSV